MSEHVEILPPALTARPAYNPFVQTHLETASDRDKIKDRLGLTPEQVEQVRLVLGRYVTAALRQKIAR